MPISTIYIEKNKRTYVVTVGIFDTLQDMGFELSHEDGLLLGQNVLNCLLFRMVQVR